MGVLRTIFWILLGFYLLKVIGRLMRPWLHTYARRKTEDFFSQASMDTRNRQGSESRVGEVTVDKTPSGQRHSNKKVGEYIEYEEVE